MKVGVLLAAGASRRMGRAKALVKTHGEVFATRSSRTLWSVCDLVIVVLGHDAKRLQRGIDAEFVRLVEEGRLHDDVTGAKRRSTAPLEVHFVVNRAWAKGMYGSARLGLKRALKHKPESVLLLPVDHPNVRDNTVQLLAAAMDAALSVYKGTRAEKARFAYGVVPRVRGRRGHPLVMSPGLVARVAADGRAEDLSDSVRRNARLVGYLDVSDPGVVRNRNRAGE